MAHISTHVLDTALGRPAQGMVIHLYRRGERLRTAQTNADGRTDGPLLQSDALTPGPYEIVFEVGTAFWDVITIRFVISDGASNYHVPLLLSPFGYSTYRGS